MVVQNFTIEQFDMIFRHSQDYVFFMKRECENYRYMAVSDSVVTLFAQNPVGQLLTDVIDEHTVQHMIPFYHKAIETAEQTTYQDYTHFHQAQKFETTLYPIHQQDGDYVLAFTKALRYERELGEYYLFTRSLFFNSSLSTILLSNEGNIYEVSLKALEEMGIATHNITNKLFFTLPIFERTDAIKIKEAIAQINHDQYPASLMVTLQKNTKEPKYVLISMNKMQVSDGLTGIFVLLQDVTNYHIQTEQLRLTSRDLAHVQQALDSTLEMVVTDINGTIVEVNEPFCRGTKYKRHELMNMPMRKLNSRKHPKSYFKGLWETVLAGKIWRGEICNHTKYGEPYWVDTTIIPLKDEQGHINQFMCINLNISEKKAIMTELRNVDRIFRMITEHTSDLIAITNEDGILIYVSPSYSKLLQYSQDELQGTFYATILHGKSKNLWNSKLYNEFAKEGEYSFEFEIEGRNGQVYLVETSLAVVHDPMRPNVSQIMMASREITQRKQKESELMYMAYHDSLTSLPNRRYLVQEFAQYKKDALQYNESFAIIYLDGDNFKGVNDIYGHDIGDSFLREFGKALRQSIRMHDVVVRLGGDEFAIVVKGLTRDRKMRKEQVYQVIADIHERLAQGWHIERNHFAPTSSMGISFFPEDGMDLRRLLDASDLALLQAKQRGKNGHFFYEDTKI